MGHNRSTEPSDHFRHRTSFGPGPQRDAFPMRFFALPLAALSGCWVVLSCGRRKKPHGWGTRARHPNDVFCMLRRPSAASPTVPVGALRALWNVTESAITGEPLVYSTIRDAPSAPLAMRWPTVTVKYRYNRTQ